MASTKKLEAVIMKAVGQTSLARELSRYVSNAPEWLDHQEDVWNVAPLHARSDVKTWTLDFGRIAHLELRAVARAHGLWQIVEKQLGPMSLLNALNAFIFLSYQLGARPLRTLKSEDFYLAERDISSRYGEGTSVRLCADLQRIGKWLSINAGMRLDYKSMLNVRDHHGREATNNERDCKLLSDVVIAELLASRHRRNLYKRDRFFLAAIAISASTGFRLAELLTLPADCLIKDQGTLLVRSFSAKNGKPAPRPIPPELADIVIEAVDHILEVTQSARERARDWVHCAPIDWVSVTRDTDPVVFEYFVRGWLSNWIADPDNRMTDSHCAYYSHGSSSKWVPIADLLHSHNGNVSSVSRDIGLSRDSVMRLIRQMEASQRGEVYLGSRTANARRSFDTDRRFASARSFCMAIGRNLSKSRHYSLLQTLVDESRTAQISQSIFYRPAIDPDLENRYRFSPAVLCDPKTKKVLLSKEEALFVLFENQLSESHRTNKERVKAVSIGQFNHWLSGYSRDRGTGTLGDAVCARLGILDPRTNEPAVFTNHDFRHWLETAYENGGLSQTQIAILFNRSSTKSNSIYDQTSSRDRHERLKDAMADGLLIGHAAEAYARIADESPEDAAEYLENATKFQNPMPHGICRLNWALEACPHTLSCFSCGDAKDDVPQPCEHLIVDITDAAQIEEIEQIYRNSRSILAIMHEDGAKESPQYAQFHHIFQSTSEILKRAGRS